ncbi:putative protein kinase RLK-Pelle-WAK family [Medicago truncatula]|uniref:Protein kinase domain-containing protein n=1 Tax=Medicago truncatula TaxID=3880 RepID=A0A396J2Q1_MEDTR|nr:putative protein kinase RLK-Pelle-WAK family [Medicago truncatula]
MAVEYSKQLFLMVVVAVFYTKAATQPMSLPNCTAKCGSIKIPFPFGITKDCSLDNAFLINCNKTSSTASNSTKHVAFLSKTNQRVLNISLNGELHVAWPVARHCYPKKSKPTTPDIKMPHFHVSPTQNKLIAVGCDTMGLLEAIDSKGNTYTTACVALCNRLSDIVANESCSGPGCCEISIPKGRVFTEVAYISEHGLNNNQALVQPFNPCGYTFLVENGAYRFAITDLQKLKKRNFPVLLDWAVGNQTCQQARKDLSTYACKADKSKCYDAPTHKSGYLCRCRDGYWGNPYLNHGCQGLLVGSFYAYWALKKIKIIKLKEEFFKQNGGLLLEQQIVKHGGSSKTLKIFTIEELNEATSNFNEGKILGQGGQGTVYKGVLEDKSIVAIKKSKISDPNQIESFINEVAVLSQINHRNVVKLVGCCLETEVPLLVYEFIPNGTVYEHIHDQNESRKLTWKTRLRIAKETAGVLAYLHSAASTPIIHRDVKSTNILLDENLTAKVADFGASKIVPLDKTQITTLVQGTLGYLDPEYFHTSQLTEKSDVYSFGVVLAELLTGEKALSFGRPEVDRNLAMYFVSWIKEDQLLHILDKNIDEKNIEHLKEVALIAERCLRVKSEERPTMKEVAMGLEGILVTEENENMINATPSVINVEDGDGGSGFNYSYST